MIEPGGFFGEMSMLTGEPRTATVRAVGDVRVLEIPAERFREVALERPGLIEHISGVVATRRAGLDEARAAAAAGSRRRARHALRAHSEVSQAASAERSVASYQFPVESAMPAPFLDLATQLT